MWGRVVSPRGYTQVRGPTTRAPLSERRLELSELEPQETKERQHHSGFVVCAVTGKAVGTGYVDASDYEKLTRQQRGQSPDLK